MNADALFRGSVSTCGQWEGCRMHYFRPISVDVEVGAGSASSAALLGTL